VGRPDATAERGTIAGFDDLFSRADSCQSARRTLPDKAPGGLSFPQLGAVSFSAAEIAF
jgi:hypothetical protein